MLKTLNTRTFGGVLSTTSRKSPIGLRLYSKYAKNDQIFVHPKDKGTFKYTLSPNEDSVPVGHGSSKTDISPTNFQSNSSFLTLLQQKIDSSIHNDFSFQMEATTFANSYMPIYDYREIPRYGRIPEIDNIFGYVQVNESGKIVPGTYEPNNMYRLCNGAGLVRLSDHLYEEMRDQCETHA